VEEGIRLLDLAHRAHELFENQPSAEKRKLLDFVLSNCRWKDGQLEAEYRKLFNMLAVAVAAGQTQADVIAPESGNFENWLPGMDSNHDKNNSRRMCKLQNLQWSKMPHWTRKTNTRT
jgi:hypothetical protein